MSEVPAAPIRGSWEDLLTQAQQLAANRNDDAIPLFQKVVNRIGNMPVAQRMAANQRLQRLWMTAAVHLHMYLSMRGRYDEAIDLLDSIIAASEADQRVAWERHASDVLIQAGRSNEAVARSRQRAESDQELENWADLVSVYAQLEDYAQAADTLDLMETQIEADWSASAGQLAQEQVRKQALLAHLRSMVALEAGEGREGIAWFEKAVALDPEYLNHVSWAYTHLIRTGHYAEGLALIQRDQGHPVRTYFWRGLAQFRMGNHAEARRLWRRAVDVDLKGDEWEQVTEFVLSHYYLGDREGTGLRIVLQILQEEVNNMPWSLSYLAGLGWAQRRNLRSARANFETAMLHRRSQAEGWALPAELWHHCQELAEEDVCDQLAEYFHVGDA